MVAPGPVRCGPGAGYGPPALRTQRKKSGRSRDATASFFQFPGVFASRDTVSSYPDALGLAGRNVCATDPRTRLDRGVSPAIEGISRSPGHELQAPFPLVMDCHDLYLQGR